MLPTHSIRSLVPLASICTDRLPLTRRAHRYQCFKGMKWYVLTDLHGDQSLIRQPLYCLS